MPRQSISLTEKNDAWLKHHVEDAKEYASKSELVNELIRQARRNEAINQKLIDAESSGFVDQSKEEIRSEFKSDLKSQ
ncbi:type II toxin-antitoxin system ParD family antitoxin [Aliiglaciecola sp. M165]|uniref:ribbon-helix-helix domain-containing protein n=1 Tax=Aliiglaciecola sp. M165 TaxID=2593649 RepID=UPI00117F8303|nr:CopG family transcriptional regulator [Aliiglaciecola sp. M165]TRY32520.1 CopG family transcriptional regulator [Aliiglaciecola sp. M165]